jgi:hypothetical protein
MNYKNTVCSLHHDRYFAPDYWSKLLTIFSELECVVILGPIETSIFNKLRNSGKEVDSSFLCLPDIRKNHTAINALLSLTWYGAPLRVVFVTRSEVILDLFHDFYDEEECVAAIEPILNRGVEAIGKSRNVWPGEKSARWCFSWDADLAVISVATTTSIPETTPS